MNAAVAPWSRAWSEDERRAVWEAFTTLARTARAEVWFVRWPALDRAEAVVKQVTEGEGQ